MKRSGLVAVHDERALIIRDDMRGNTALTRHLQFMLPGLSTATVGQPVTGEPQPSASPVSCSNVVGSTCSDGLKVISVNSCGEGLFAESYSLDAGFETLAGGFSGPLYGSVRGPGYTFEPMLQCLASEFASVKDNLLKLAEWITGPGLGTLATYFRAGSITAVLRSARGLIAGTVSFTAFWDVVVAAASIVTLPEILTAAGIAAGVGLLFLAIKCALS